MVTKLYQYIPGWTVACISPYVSKVANYFRMTGHPFELVQQDLAPCDRCAPREIAIHHRAGRSNPDFNEIIAYAKATYGDTLDKDLSREDRAVMVAWTRLVDEHLYWSGVIQPRWRMDAGWGTYVPIDLWRRQSNPAGSARRP